MILYSRTNNASFNIHRIHCIPFYLSSSSYTLTHHHIIHTHSSSSSYTLIIHTHSPSLYTILTHSLTLIIHTHHHYGRGLRPVKAKMPLVPGHEGVGIVHQIGERVTQHKVGDRVGIAWLHSACGMCEYCLTGWETLCSKQETTGKH